MAKVNSWYSAKPECEVYHNNTSCTEGNNIEVYNVREGTGNKRICDHCKKLNGGSFPGHGLFGGALTYSPLMAAFIGRSKR